MVAKCFVQGERIDFAETYFMCCQIPVYLSSFGICCLKKHAHSLNGRCQCILNGKLEQNLYMEQPEVVLGKENLVCQLKKSLYELNQSPGCRNQSLKEFMVSQGFSQSTLDQCVKVRLPIVKYNLEDYKFVSTPIDVNLKLAQTDGCNVTIDPKK